MPKHPIVVRRHATPLLRTAWIVRVLEYRERERLKHFVYILESNKLQLIAQISK